MQRRAILSICVTLAAVSAGLFSGFSPVEASSHREAPFVTEHPKVDGTDFYMFRSYEEGRDGFVTLIANYIPLQDAYGGPNYFTMDPSARYRINIENNNDAVEDIVFEFQFFNILNNGALPVGDETVEHPLSTITPLAVGIEPNEAEIYVVRVIRGDDPPQFATNGRSGDTSFAKALDYFGEKTFPDYEAYANTRITPIQIPGCGDGKVFVGQRKESFAVNLGEVFDLVNLDPVGDPTAKRPSTQDKNITSLILEVPIDCLTEDSGGPVIGGWTTAHLPRTRVLLDDPTFDDPAQESSDFVQVSRLGNPLVNEVVIGLPDKNRFNATQPCDDRQFLPYVNFPTLGPILASLFGVQALDGPNFGFGWTILFGHPLAGTDRFDLPLKPSDMLRLNVETPAVPWFDQDRLGAVAGGDPAGYPNGRRPGDDVVDILLRDVMGLPCHLGLNLCDPADAPDGLLPYTDQTYQGPDQFDDAFPYLRTPLPGSPNPYRTFSANLQGSQEVPPVDTDAFGWVDTVPNADNTELNVWSQFTGINNVTQAAIYEGAPGAVGDLLCELPEVSPIKFVCPVDAAFLEALQRGNTYVNVHSGAHPGGEIRGQLR